MPFLADPTILRSNSKRPTLSARSNLPTLGATVVDPTPAAPSGVKLAAAAAVVAFVASRFLK